MQILAEQEFLRKRQQISCKQGASTNPFMQDIDWLLTKYENTVGTPPYHVSLTDHPDSEFRAFKHKSNSVQPISNNIDALDYQSEAAKQIITEVSTNASNNETNNFSAYIHKRSTPKEKRRHHTAPHQVNMDSIQQIRMIEQINKNVSSKLYIFIKLTHLWKLL